MTTRKAITSIALIHAKHCDDTCKALQERMQSFAWVVAKLCVRKLKNLLIVNKLTSQQVATLIA